MRVFFLGDIFGKPGRKAVKSLLPNLKKEHGVEMVIANAENLAGGKGATEKTLREMEAVGVDIFTGGNHIFHEPEIFNSERKNLVRPANYPQGTPGVGYVIHKNLLIINIQGRVFLNHMTDCPFRAAEKIIAENPQVEGVIIDFHAEATSEKYALKWFLNGKVSAIFGTHTHVATADAHISPEGTFYVSDIGMTGPFDSGIGIKPEIAVDRFIKGLPVRHEVADGRVIFQGFLLDISAKKAENFSRIAIFQE